ncbi:hypothetical protein [Massilia niastensis]|uniref:hypothetical protein n=1 Tax=Massilia niastensis TaxID=544911 RepID=UPI0003A28FCD|nr:hypothetical protein [Massilia niastensis]
MKTQQRPSDKPKNRAVVADKRNQQQHDDDALDEALDESFPASDPVAIDVTSVEPAERPRKRRS